VDREHQAKRHQRPYQWHRGEPRQTHRGAPLKERACDRFLTDQEIRDAWAALNAGSKTGNRPFVPRGLLWSATHWRPQRVGSTGTGGGSTATDTVTATPCGSRETAFRAPPRLITCRSPSFQRGRQIWRPHGPQSDKNGTETGVTPPKWVTTTAPIGHSVHTLLL
jgi:hypothetical protein